MEPLRTITKRTSGSSPGRGPLLAAAAVVLLAVVGLAAWFGRDTGQSIDTDVAADGTTDDGTPGTVDLDSLVGSTWTLRFGGGPGGADGEIVLVDDFPITLTFDTGTFGGTAACNGYGAGYSIDGNQLIIDGLSWTEMGCRPDVQAAEQAYLAALTDVDGINLVDDELALSGPSTELIFTRQQPVPTEELVDTLWLLETLIEGETATTVLGDPATLSINSDGTFSGSTGCRTFSGRYQIFGADVQFNEFAAGEEQCPTELAGQDGHVFAVLGDGFTAEVDGDRLTVTSAGGDGLAYRAITPDELAETASRPVASDAELLDGIEWVLVAGYDDPDAPERITIEDPRSIEPDQPITLMFGDGTYSGTVVCKEYSAAAQIGNGTMNLDVLELRDEGCEGDELNTIANRYIDAIPLMTEFGLEADGRRLVMNGSDIELHFERAE